MPVLFATEDVVWVVALCIPVNRVHLHDLVRVAHDGALSVVAL